MRYTNNPEEIKKILVGRTELEQKIALDLTDIFRTGVLFDKINAAVISAFEALKGLKERDPGLKMKIEEVEKSQDFLFDQGRNKVEYVLDTYGKTGTRKLTPEQCGNLIRFYGEVVEALAFAHKFYWMQERMKQISWRYGGGGETFKAIRSIQDYEESQEYLERRARDPMAKRKGWVQVPGEEGKGQFWKKVESSNPRDIDPPDQMKIVREEDVHVAEADQGTVWRKGQYLFARPGTKDGKKVQVPKSVAQWKDTSDQSGHLSWQKSVVNAPDAGPGGRRRGEQKSHDKAGKPLDSYFGKKNEWKPNPFYDIIPGSLFINPEAQKLHIGKEHGGAMEWKMEETSTIGVIDRVFGLPYGADISGTTSDELYFLTGCADINSGDPVMKMLPLAVIVGEYHHSLLEVAAAMSLKRVINYQIGFYRTLLPPLPQGIPAQKQRVDIEQLLVRCETDSRNVHILLHYKSDKQIAGGFIAEDKGELDAFRKLGTVDIHLWPQFNKLPAYPPEDDIIQLLNSVGLGNALLQLRRKALRRAA